jgi:hypothetical protein
LRSTIRLLPYLTSLYRKLVNVAAVPDHGAAQEEDDLKGFGHGSPLFIEYDAEGVRKKAVIETM